MPQRQRNSMARETQRAPEFALPSSDYSTVLLCRPYLPNARWG